MILKKQINTDKICVNYLLAADKQRSEKTGESEKFIMNKDFSSGSSLIRNDIRHI
jgi:hypothetical protein